MLPGDLPIEKMNTTLGFIRDALTYCQQPRSYGTILRYSRKPCEPTVPTIVLGFPDLIGIPALTLPNTIADTPILLISDRAVPTLFESQGPIWHDGVHYEQKIGISDISVGGRDCLNEAGSFGGWISGKDGRKFGLTCAHCLPTCQVGESVVSLSPAEITSRVNTIIPYTEDCPESRPAVKRSQARKEELELLLCRYSRVADNNGVEMRNGSSIRLVGKELGRLVAKKAHKCDILTRHNQQLHNQGMSQFAFPDMSVSLSWLDWAVFQGDERRLVLLYYP